MKKRITTFTIILSIIVSLISIPTSVRAKLKEVPEKEYADMPQAFKQLDLTAVANRGFADDVAGDGKGGWTAQGSSNDLSRFDLRGLCNLRGVDFNIIDPDKNGGNSCVVLRGQNDMSVPTSAEMIVDDKIAGVYFLHASAYVQKEVGKYVFVYDDGTKEEVPIRGDKDVFNWWGSAQGDYTVTAWTGSNAMTSAVSLYMFCCENPKPSKKVSKIIAETTGKGSYLMLVVALYDDKDVLIGTELVKKTLSTAEPYIQTEEFSTKGVKTIRTFLWDSGDIKPYFSSETFKAASEADD